MKMTYERLKIVAALKEGPKTWTSLRLAYYGEERAKSPASTSFHNQLQRMMEGGVIKKTPLGYELVKCEHETHEEGGPTDYGPECSYAFDKYWDCKVCDEVDNEGPVCDKCKLPKGSIPKIK